MRDTIRAELASIFTGVSQIGNVYTSRHQPTNLDHLPIAYVRFVSEERERLSMGNPRSIYVTSEWQLGILAADTSANMEETLDTLSAAVEAQITDRTLSGNVQDCWVTSTSYSVDADGEESIGEAAITLQIEYTVTVA